MYREHYNLKSKPFQISPDPRFLWLGETHNEALSMLQYGITDSRGLLLLVGDVGTGKTTLINAFLDGLDADTIVATITDPGLEKLEFYNFIAAAFKMGKTFDNKGDFLVKFIHFLHKAHAQNKKTLLIVDEAQRLDDGLLEEIRQLSNIERKDTKLLNIFLVGQNELDDKIADPANRALKQRITTRFLIGPLKKHEVKEYIKFRLSVAGADRKIFTSAAVRAIIAKTNCYPRLINILCDHALLTAYTRSKKRVDAKIIRECARELTIGEVQAPPSRPTKATDGQFSHQPSTIFGLKPSWALTMLGLILALGLAAIAYVNLPGAAQAPAPVPSPQPRPVALAVSAPPPAAPAQAPPAPQSSALQTSAPPSAAPLTPPAPLNAMFTVTFSSNSNDFDAAGYEVLNRVVEAIGNRTDVSLVVSGYTDAIGDPNYNRRLSEFRANMVKSFLVGQGIPPSRIETFGRGPENPVQPNDTPEGRRANRRVEIELTSE